MFHTIVPPTLNPLICSLKNVMAIPGKPQLKSLKRRIARTMIPELFMDQPCSSATSLAVSQFHSLALLLPHFPELLVLLKSPFCFPTLSALHPFSWEAHPLTHSFDRYVAICHPLHYGVIMNRGASMQMVASTWFSGGLLVGMYSAGTFTLSFCRTNMIQQFFCDVPSLMNICSERHIVVDVSVIIGMSFGFISFISIFISYVYIFSTVLTFPSTESRSKAFSTCLPHTAVFMFFPSNGACAYLKPPSDSPSALDLMVSVFYTVVPPSTFSSTA
ncbi:olfactory receptor 14A16-like [Tachyglossus aculeatus]|uniref:olfactory receptor 14A16-like n=1 Tax=Tachyglossus aculeatus TaxID=9261 RepID=UPI0018F47878|nr:olfactory receptor 14A16-like [Tachyglossus aculeatus]